jgi:hypothetical protein
LCCVVAEFAAEAFSGGLSGLKEGDGDILGERIFV